ncbi:YdeI/OmpD-associated family protein [Paenibacillus sedimenti]|uniref:YdeI/OmpD-associated family protein n=1 Tax=Paenibacillus sedimenti TaxID=2770274 RepID=A0A926KRW5_9BACL|nr:YdeI/OmpD-associated family protein [Paenibacillus sedimenti]MBD0381771.1 YdeI/OmpD-associated family protein [Paenibacillus sedimenti]
MSNDIVKKLRLAGCKRALIMNAPEGYIGKLDPLPEGVVLTEQKESDQAYDFVQVFVYNMAEVQSLTPQAIQAVIPEGMLWINYPKGTSKIKTDINRDSGWQTVTDLQFEGVSLVSIDETWSAMRFRPIGLVKSQRSERQAKRAENANKSPLPADKTVIVPDDLAAAFQSNLEAQVFYETLSYTNRKEYVRWITDAKRDETRSGRVEKTIDKLSRGIKNPMVKE